MPAMLSGFNTNVRHRGLLFHVQTEDSGLAHPHVITLLYQQGSILASEKSSYADRVGSEQLGSELKALMARQHGAMVERLRRGELDAVIAERLGPDALGPAPSSGSAPPVADGPEPARAGSAPAQRETPAQPLAAAAAGEQPLDELILDYLVESARKRKRRAQ